MLFRAVPLMALVAAIASPVLGAPLLIRHHKDKAVANAASNCTTTAATTSANTTTTVDTNSTSTSTSTAAVEPVGGTFTELSYDQFQISDGTAGNALAEANAVFVDPFSGRDLATVTAAELKALQNMREAAESAETDQFDPQLDTVSGDAKTALQNGKIKNKVLKLVGEIQGLQIQAAQGKDTASSVTEETTKLNNNIALDKAAAGQPSTGVA